MKKILIGLAAGALAVTATGVGTASAAGTSVYDQIVAGSPVGETLIDASGLAATLDDCGNDGNNNGLPDYTVFFPYDDSVFTAVLGALGMSLGELAAQPALVKQVLLYHVHKGNISPVQLADNSNSTWSTMGGLTLLKTTKVDYNFALNPFGFTTLSDYADDTDVGIIDGAFAAAGLPITFDTGATKVLDSVPTGLTFYINGYEVTNVSTTLTWDWDYNTYLKSKYTTAEFEARIEAEAADLADLIMDGASTDEILAGVEEMYTDLALYLDTSDDKPVLDESITSSVAAACNGYVYYIRGILSPSSASLTQGLTADGSTSVAPASGELPKTGSESMALTYAALASLIMGAGVLVIRRRSVA